MNVFVNMRTHTIGEDEYLTVQQMAACVHRSEQAIYNLIHKGNTMRKMKFIKIGNSVLIPISEITDFPFTSSGRADDVYYYKITIDGNVMIDEERNNGEK